MVLVGRRDSYHSIQFNYSKANFARGGPTFIPKPPLGISLEIYTFVFRDTRTMAMPIFGQSQTAQYFELVKFLRLSGCKFCTLYTRTPLGTGQIVYVNTSWSAENPRTKMDLIGLGKWRTKNLWLCHVLVVSWQTTWHIPWFSEAITTHSQHSHVSLRKKHVLNIMITEFFLKVVSDLETPNPLVKTALPNCFSIGSHFAFGVVQASTHAHTFQAQATNSPISRCKSIHPNYTA